MAKYNQKCRTCLYEVACIENTEDECIQEEVDESYEQVRAILGIKEAGDGGTE